MPDKRGERALPVLWSSFTRSCASRPHGLVPWPPPTGVAWHRAGEGSQSSCPRCSRGCLGARNLPGIGTGQGSVGRGVSSLTASATGYRGTTPYAPCACCPALIRCSLCPDITGLSVWCWGCAGGSAGHRSGCFSTAGSRMGPLGQATCAAQGLMFPDASVMSCRGIPKPPAVPLC